MIVGPRLSEVLSPTETPRGTYVLGLFPPSDFTLGFSDFDFCVCGAAARDSGGAYGESGDYLHQVRRTPIH